LYLRFAVSGQEPERAFVRECWKHSLDATDFTGAFRFVNTNCRGDAMRLAVLAVVTVVLGGRFAKADKPYEVPDLSAVFLGGTWVTPDRFLKEYNDRQVAGKPRAGVVMLRAYPTGPLKDVPPFSIVSKIGATAVTDPENIRPVISELKPGVPVKLTVAAAGINQKGQLYWALPKPVNITPVTYGEWVDSVTEVAQDKFLDRWVRAVLPGEFLSEPHVSCSLRIKVDAKGQPLKMQWTVTYTSSDWVFANSVTVRVGDSKYRFSGNFGRTVGDSGRVWESLSMDADAEVLAMIEDVAFGQGEVAILFEGRTESGAQRLTDAQRLGDT